MLHKYTISLFRLLPSAAPLSSGAGDDFLSMTNSKLKKLLDERGVEYKSNATKPELIDLLGG